MKFGIGLLIVSVLFVSCASRNKNFKPALPDRKNAKIIIYRPHQFVSMWDKYDIYIGNNPLIRLEDSGYFITSVKPGSIVVNSHHFQEDEFVTRIV